MIKSCRHDHAAFTDYNYSYLFGCHLAYCSRCKDWVKTTSEGYAQAQRNREEEVSKRLGRGGVR